MHNSLMHMSSGLDVDVFDLQATDIILTDIAHNLANQCRFVGACKHHYSVAQHSVLVALRVYMTTWDPTLTRCALLHDASEAYLGDVARPLKFTKMFDFYRDVEAQVQRRIMRAFNLPETMDPRIERADNEILALEAHTLFNPPFLPASDSVPPFELVRWRCKFVEWNWHGARRRFMDVYHNPEALDKLFHHITAQEKTFA